MNNFIDLSGKSFNRWTVLKYTGKGLWFCRCSCGTERNVIVYNLIKGISRSCGCYRDEKATLDGFKHGLSDTPIHKRWMDIHQRCENPKNKRYKDWGGRGIKICDRWNRSNPNGFINYVSDIKSLGENPDDSYTIDRIDNDGDYSPENIRWASKYEQRLNQRNYRVRIIEYLGFKKSMKEWAGILNTHSSNILYFIKRGKDFDWIYKHYTKEL
jgi:hypothetical protein